MTNEFERQPVPEEARLGFGSFLGQYAGEHTAGTELMIGPAGGGPPSTWRRLVPDHREADKPRWSADGHLMYFLSRGSGEYFNLWAR